MRSTRGTEMIIRATLVATLAIATMSCAAGSSPALSNARGGDRVIALAGPRLVVVRPDGSGTRNITPPSVQDAAMPEWSPSGRKLVFVCGINGSQDICLIGRDGSHFKRLTHGDAADLSPDWSPNGKRIAYIRGGVIVIMGKKGDRTHRVAHTRFARSLGWGTGRRIVFSRSSQDGGELFSIRPNGDARKRLSTPGKGGEIQPEWSPNGRTILFTREVSGFTDDIYVMRRDGSDAQRVNKRCCWGKNASWSPKGDRIVYQSSSGVHIMRIDGSHRRLLKRGYSESDWRSR